MDTTKSKASRQAETNPRFIVMWHNPLVEANTQCAFATKKAAMRTLANLTKWHPEWNVVMGATGK